MITMPTDLSLLNTRLPVRLDWWRTLARCLDVSPFDFQTLTQKLCEFSHDHGLEGDGLLTPKLRCELVHTFDALKIRLVGPNMTPRCVLATHHEAQIYDDCEAIVRAADGATFVTPFVPQLLALRGTELRADGVWQTNSAAHFAQAPYGQRDHFSSDKPNCFDSVFVLFWRGTEKHAMLFEGTVNPNAIWSAGTAHLCDGQYTFKLGRHRTYSRPHIDAILQASIDWPADWLYESDDEHVRYIALEGTSPVNVVRSHGNALDISDEDIIRAENKISEFDATYVDQNKIKINIHTCPYDVASSLGCQNIRPDQYADFIRAIAFLETQSRERFGYAFETWYTLIDASRT